MRVTTLRFTKDYETVADAFTSMLKNAVVTETEEHGKKVIEIEGDFEHFVIEDMDMWQEHIKFEIKDNRIQDEEDREARAIISEGMPGMGEVLFSSTIAFVFRRVKMVERVTTIVQHLHDGKEVSSSREIQDSEPETQWVDITREFGQKVRIKS